MYVETATRLPVCNKQPREKKKKKKKGGAVLFHSIRFGRKGRKACAPKMGSVCITKAAMQNLACEESFMASSSIDVNRITSTDDCSGAYLSVRSSSVISNNPALFSSV